MPIGAALAPLITGLAAGGISGIAGAMNTRPPSLDKVQRGALDTLIPNLLKTATSPATIDPTQQKLMFGDIARSQTGAFDAATHALVSRGLGRSGLLADALTKVANTAQGARDTASLGLQQEAVQLKQDDISKLLAALGVSNIPGQSAGGGFMAGLAPILAYSLQKMSNNAAGVHTGP